MYSGYLFLCGEESLAKCINEKQYSCTGEMVEATEDIKAGSVIFLYNPQSEALIGPLTAAESEAPALEPGTWTETLDDRDLSANLRVEWEELHELQNAPEKLAFLRDIKTCRLTHFQTQDALNALKEAPVYSRLPKKS